MSEEIALTVGYESLKVSIFNTPDIVTPMVLAQHDFDTPTKSNLQGDEFGHIG